MISKGPLRKQVIILISSDNISKFIKNSSLHVANINWSLRNMKSEVLVNFICLDLTSIMVVTNKITVQSDLHVIENYVKKVDNINSINVDIPCLSQSKSYLKIISIPYFPYDNSIKCLTSSDMESIIKQNQIFDNIVLASKPQVIKMSPKSDMLIVWINIWNVQSRSKTKDLINRCLNVGKFITTI